MKIVFIADIHFGATNPKEQYRELRTEFLKPISKMKNIDLIVLGGDLFHKKISFNDPCIKYALIFINNIVRISIKYNACPIRILRGTRTHDCDQLDNFHYLEENDAIDFRIINHKEIEHLMTSDGQQFKVLYVPEEYIDRTEYDDLLDEDIDICCLHGTFDHVGYIKMIRSQKLNYPIWNIEDFHNVKGPVLCGHIHSKNVHKSKILYPGSFSRWCYGEEKDKGFFTVDYTPGSSRFKHTFHKNTKCKTYITKNLTDILPDITVEHIANLSHIIKDYRENNAIDFLRLKSDAIAEDKALILKEHFSSYPENDVEFKINIISEDEEDVQKLEEFNFVFDDSLSIYAKISQFLKVKDNIDIPENEIKEVITSLI